MVAKTEKPRLFGVLAEFMTPSELHRAILRAKEEGYTSLDAFTPYPVEAISEEIVNHEKSKVSMIVAAGALLGVATAVVLQYWSSAIAYPVNIGGRPLNSWPAFIPVAFELTVLFASFAAIGGMLFLNRLPRPHHPLFGVEQFERATVDRCFLLIKSLDEKFDRESTRSFLQGLGPQEVIDVER